MISFKSLASGSSGNAYLVTSNIDGIAPLLIEAGIPIKKLREKLAFGLTGLAGVIISHSHQDHSQAVKEIMRSGVDCYMSIATAAEIGVSEHYRMNDILAYHRKYISGWSVYPFLLEHDVETHGFIISDGDDKLLFIPDTGFVSQRFAGINIIAAECNHISEILTENAINGNIPAAVARRSRRNHLSLDTLLEMLKANDLSKCRHIFLIHLSSSNSDEKRMVIEVQKQSGIPTTAC